MRNTFESEQWVPFDLSLVFSFFSNPENLPRLMPRWQHARIEEAAFAAPPPRPLMTPHLPGVVAGAGTRMTLSFRAFPLSPVRLPWDAEITEFVWNDHFCDVQHRGPFQSWKHCHYLSSATRPALGENPRQTAAHADPPSVGTLIKDHVEYSLPFGLLGALANSLVVRSQLAATFRYRQQRTTELLPRFAAAVSSPDRAAT